MRTKSILTAGLAMLGLAALGVVIGTEANAATFVRRASYRSSAAVPTGTSIQVQLGSNIATDNAHPGDTWTGTTAQDIYVNNNVAIPSGSPVTGVVTNVVQGTHSRRPQLGLAVRSVAANGRSYVMNADMPPVVGDTRRAKKLGAIIGGAAVGALVGHTVAKDSHGTLIGGLAGGAAGYGLTRNALRTLQLKPGTMLTFTTRQEMAFRQ